MSKALYTEGFSLGVLGGGQLGRMLLQEALNLNIPVSVMDPDPVAPCRGIVEDFVLGNLQDYDAVYNFGKDKSVLTIEIEHVNVEALEQLEKDRVRVYPSPAMLKIVQDKGLQKEFYQKHDIPTSPFILIDSETEIEAHQDRLPFVQKTRKGGYDGKGVQVMKNAADLKEALIGPSVLEDLVDLSKEIAVIVARNPDGEMSTFPPVELEFNPEANLVEYLFSPAVLTSEQEKEAKALAKQIAEKMNLTGILAVEMFVTKKGELLVNEIAPRPHNSGHQTIEGNVTSQYAQHLRAVLNLPLGSTAITSPSVMVNLLGEKGYAGSAKYENLNKVLSKSGVYVHLYGKKTTKPFRKMGHVTVVNSDLETAKKVAKEVKEDLLILA